MTRRATNRLTRQGIADVAWIKDVAADCYRRFGRLHLTAARLRGDSARLRRVPRGEAAVDSGAVAALCFVVLLAIGAAMLAAIGAAVCAWLL